MTMHVDLSHLGVALGGGRVRLLHGEVLALPGVAVEHLFLLRRGSVLAFDGGDARQPRIIAAPAVLGLGDLMSEGRWRCLAVAHGPAEVQPLIATALGRRMATLPEGHRRLLADLAAEIASGVSPVNR